MFDRPVPADLDPDTIALQAHTVFSFLPAPLSIEVEGDRVTLQFPQASSRDHARAQHLADEAAELARNGRGHRAIKLWKQALKLDPLLVHVWRDIGMVAPELRRFSEARRHLTTALRLKRDEVGALVALAKLTMAAEQNRAHLFRQTRPQDIRPEPVYATARRLLPNLQTQRGENLTVWESPGTVAARLDLMASPESEAGV